MTEGSFLKLLPLSLVKEKMLAGDFKPNCALGTSPHFLLSFLKDTDADTLVISPP